jgi:polyferredoxin
MDKMNYPRGLIKYSTQNALAQKWSRGQILQRILRPRVLIYTVILWLLIIGLFTSLWFRDLFRVDVVRDRGVMARLTDGGKLENVYRLQIMNATEKPQHYQLAVKGLENVEIESENMEEAEGAESSEENRVILVKPAESRWVIVDLKIPDGSLEAGSHKIQFEIQSVESKETVTEKSIFLVPR